MGVAVHTDPRRTGHAGDWRQTQIARTAVARLTDTTSTLQLQCDACVGARRVRRGSGESVAAVTE